MLIKDLFISGYGCCLIQSGITGDRKGLYIHVLLAGRCSLCYNIDDYYRLVLLCFWHYVEVLAERRFYPKCGRLAHKYTYHVLAQFQQIDLFVARKLKEP